MSYTVHIVPLNIIGAMSSIQCVLYHGYSVCDHTDTHMEVVISDIVVVLSLHRVFDDKYCLFIIIKHSVCDVTGIGNEMS